jgi:hypothetical protein
MSSMKLRDQSLDRLTKRITGERQKLLAQSTALGAAGNDKGAQSCKDQASGMAKALAMVAAEKGRE